MDRAWCRGWRRVAAGVAALLGLAGLLAAAAPAVLAPAAAPTTRAGGEGARLYAERCAVCHQPGMQGVPGVYPPIADAVAAYLSLDEGRAYVVHVLAFGLAGMIAANGQRYSGLMPPVPHFTDTEIAAVLNHVAIGGKGEPPAGGLRLLTADEVRQHRGRSLSPGEVARERQVVVERLRTAGAARMYIRQCMGCHRPNGLGIPGAVPRLTGFVGYFAHLPEGRAFLVQVPGVARAPLGDEEVAAVLNFVLTTFSPAELPADFTPFTADEVRAYRAQALIDVSGARAELLRRLADAGVLPR